MTTDKPLFPDIRGLSLSRPWPWAFVNGPEGEQKRIENRRWKPPAWANWIALHAAKSYDKQGADYIHGATGQDMDLIEHAHSQIFAVARIQGYYLHPVYKSHPEYLPQLGRHERALKEAEAAGLVPNETQHSLWAFGPFCWIIGDLVPLCRPVECKGAMGLWKVAERPGKLDELRLVYLESLNAQGKPLQAEERGQLSLWLKDGKPA
jgi:hypothetical protein